MGKNKQKNKAAKRKVKQPRLPDEIQRVVAAFYFTDCFDRDCNARILPAMLTCKAFKETITPLLYRHIYISSAHQRMLLLQAKRADLCLTKQITILPCKNVEVSQQRAVTSEACKIKHDGQLNMGGEIRKWWKKAGMGDRELKGTTLPRILMHLNELQIRTVFGPQHGWWISWTEPKRVMYDPDDHICTSAKTLLKNDLPNLLNLSLSLSLNAVEIDISGPVQRVRAEFPPEQYKDSSIQFRFAVDHVLTRHGLNAISDFLIVRREGKKSKTPALTLSCKARPTMLRHDEEIALERFESANCFLSIGTDEYGPKDLLDDTIFFILSHMIHTLLYML